HEARVVEEAGPVDRAGEDRDRVAMPRPRLAIDPAPDHPGPRMPRPIQVVGKGPESLELRRESERGARDRRDDDARRHAFRMIAAGDGRVNRFRDRWGARAAAGAGVAPPA